MILFVLIVISSVVVRDVCASQSRSNELRIHLTGHQWWWEFQPDVSPEEQKGNYAAAYKLAPGPQRDVLMQQAVAHRRVFIGRSLDKSSLTLFDINGGPRIRMIVDRDGEPKLEFLEAGGKVTHTLPDDSSPMKK